jgi:hypothetical protein
MANLLVPCSLDSQWAFRAIRERKALEPCFQYSSPFGGNSFRSFRKSMRWLGFLMT